MSGRGCARRSLAACATVVLATTCVAQGVAVVPLPSIEVVGTTPLPGLPAPLKDVAGNVQTFGAADFMRQRPAHLADFLEMNPSSVSINTASGNPFQADVSFRGFVASPLLGTPQGLSVFLDGVRINEVFADVVNWDLVPTSAIATLQVVPGSNPVFGLNTLGGALAVYTKDGLRYPGTSVDASAGSFGRRSVGFETGGAGDVADWFVTGRAHDEDGWRDHSPSRVRQLFGKLRIERADSEVALSATYADNSLSGTQTLPLSMLDRPQQAYTWPDTTTNELAFVNAQAARRISSAGLWTGNAYFRRLRTDGFNSNVNGDFGTSADEPPAFNVVSGFVSNGYGGATQITVPGDLFGLRNRLTVGASADLGRTDFRQRQQDAGITGDRETPGEGAFVQTVDVRTDTRQLSVYATDTLALTARWSATVSGRWNDARVGIDDRSGESPALDGTHRFRRLNPAAGVTYALAAESTIYASWSEGMRVPSPVELTCADADAPCTLPNIFLADPPLNPVVATTWELGARRRQADGAFIDASIYRTNLADDIQFISAGSGAVNAGYFRNIGRTRRDGVEVGAGMPLGPLSLVARYSLTEATFRTPFVAHSPNNSTADAAGDIGVRNGNRIPGVPRHLFKLRVEWSPIEAFSIAAGLVAASSQYARGDENNSDASGAVPGYAIVNLDARWQFARNFELFANVSNLFDVRYQNFGILGANFFRGPADTFAPDLAAPEAFRAPGAPFGAWIGLRYRFGTAS